MLTLYFAPGSSSMAPHIALHEIGAAFDTRSLSLATKDTRTPEFLAINPVGKVPVLLIDGRVLTEVAGILFYLARRHPEAGLLPAGDIEAEAQIVSWMSYLASAVHPSRGQGLDPCRAAWTTVEKRLGGRDWVVGDRYSIADIHLFRLYWRVRSFLDLPAGTLPAVEAHYARMMARPAVIKTIEIESKVAGHSLPAA
jgi:glutathione S-transferase